MVRLRWAPAARLGTRLARGARAIPAPHRDAMLVIAIAVVMASLFVSSYSLALARPTPHHIPAGLVEGPHAPPAADAVRRELAGDLRFHRYATAHGARRAITEQTIYAALILTGRHPRLVVASASGASVARVLEQLAQRISTAKDTPIEVVDLRPLPPSDPQGLVSFYVTLGATILGMVCSLQLSARARGLGLRAWLACALALAILGGLLLALVSGPIIGALTGPYLELAAILAAEVFVVSLVTSTFIVLLDRWAIIPSWLLFVVLGNSSSGGAVAPPLLPGFYRFIGRFLPPGATVESVRSAVYFPHAQHLEPMIVQGIWLLCALGGLVLFVRLMGRGPAGPVSPAPDRSESRPAHEGGSAAAG